MNKLGLIITELKANMNQILSDDHVLHYYLVFE